jgi:sodium-independent sulfate anion transporter 11
MTTASKVGHVLAKGLGIKLHYREPTGLDPVTRGESTFSAGTADTYVELEPSTIDWLKDTIPERRQVGLYFYNLFPFLRWIGKYNLQWLIGDLVAGQCSQQILSSWIRC